jgi:Lon protease-like protein|tara:strand:+ start:287 stop:877 length:591 start_codon:yes stop_codon:yes gene_type:complete
LKKNNIPLFPLGLVSLPGTMQSLQIFEPRYINMVKSCMQNNSGFVITLSTQKNNETNYGISKNGTYVEIIDFNNLPNGLLGITVKSIHKVKINNITELDDGLHMADAEALIDPEVDDQAILAEHPDLINILMQLVKHPKINDKYLKVDFNSADSVSYHLAGLIPLTSNEKQSLLEAFDANQRMKILSSYIKKLSSQ